MTPAHALATLALTLIGAPIAAIAGDIADYVFNVPVSVSKLGPGHRAEVQCHTEGLKGLGAGQASKVVPLDPNGNYSGTIQVKIPAGNQAPMFYQCDLLIDGAAPPGFGSATSKTKGKL